ncbi:SDR family oxidoreductase [Paenibacillus sp. SI8]|uniref:SDR family oxidoreductase n=1 Tax=unclassified Paenibacillus TaxID=185978 RepID=UPI0034655146
MNKSIKIFGGTGRTGSLIASLLADKGESVVIATRDPHNVRTIASSFIHYRYGDITQKEGMKELLTDSKAIIIIVESDESANSPYSPKNVHYLGLLNIIEIVKELQLEVHVVLVTQIYITRPELYPEVKEIIFWRGQAEQALRDSGIAYTIVRPSWLTNEASQPVRLEQGDTGNGSITRIDVARICAEASLSLEARSKTFETFNDERANSSPFIDWSERFSQLKTDG